MNRQFENAIGKKGKGHISQRGTLELCRYNALQNKSLDLDRIKAHFQEGKAAMPLSDLVCSECVRYLQTRPRTVAACPGWRAMRPVARRPRALLSTGHPERRTSWATPTSAVERRDATGRKSLTCKKQKASFCAAVTQLSVEFIDKEGDLTTQFQFTRSIVIQDGHS